MKHHSISSLSKKLSSFSKKEIEGFFNSFFTPKELETLEGRMALIDLLLRKVPQRKIAEDLGISFTQITRGSHELQNGAGKKFFPKFFK